jgi:hypothetical protein
MLSCTCHYEPGAGPLGQIIPELDGFGEIVPGIDVQERKRKRSGTKCLQGQVHHHNGILAAGKKQDGTFKLCGHFAHHKYGLFFENAKMRRFSPGAAVF